MNKSPKTQSDVATVDACKLKRECFDSTSRIMVSSFKSGSVQRAKESTGVAHSLGSDDS